MSGSWKVMRHYASGGKTVIKTGLTLEQAKAHCQDPETSSTTATSSHAKNHTKMRGDWFDAFTEQ